MGDLPIYPKIFKNVFITQIMLILYATRRFSAHIQLWTK
jgi:hypothetical protein